MASDTTTPPLIVVVGETASGKSAMAMEIARRYAGEIICADSRTIYKGMDIGTAKPSVEERQEISHHLIDIVAPSEPFSAADFKEQANQKIKEITARGHVPVMVGGTGLYVDSVLFNYQFGSKAEVAGRQLLAEYSTSELHAMLTQRGVTVPAGEVNKRHLVRALERGYFSADEDRAVMRPYSLVIGVSISRSKLRERIEKRVEVMFRQGLRKEVDELVKKYGWGSEALTGIGYREFEAFYKEEISMGQVKRQIVQDTLNLAKRQRTWFRRNPAIQWVETVDEALVLTARFLGQ